MLGRHGTLLAGILCTGTAVPYSSVEQDENRYVELLNVPGVGWTWDLRRSLWSNPVERVAGETAVHSLIICNVMYRIDVSYIFSVPTRR